MTELSGKVCVVTGATRGIGRPTAQALAEMGAAVVVHGRDAEAVGAARKAIVSSTGNANVTGVVASFDSLNEVRRLAAEITGRHDRIDVLVNNAGLGETRRRLTPDGFERQFAVNHLAPFLLTTLLLDRLKASAPARIVTVSSMAHRRGALDFDDLNWEHRKYSSIGAYSDSKLANILFTHELARRLKGSGVTANCLHPGVVATNIFNGLGLLGRIFGMLGRPWLLSPEAGARTSIYLASSPEVANVSGRFFDKCEPVEPAPAANDPDAAARLWQLSEEMTAAAR